jgi:uncharacterized membrane protein YcaP (DUF421 family)
MNLLYIYLLQTDGFSWKELLLGSEEWNFLAETVLRTSIMFLVILTSLRVLGKRAVKQLSVFELVIIIGLGSAAGDPMFYKDVGLLPSLTVFILFVSFYLLTTQLVSKNKKIEHLVEGKPVCLVEEGIFSIENFKKEPLAQDEFFAELRLKGVSHLGQIENAIIETGGGISIYFYPDNDVKYGLPILPGSLEEQTKKISTTDNYACTFCGYTEKLQRAEKHNCPKCKKDLWVKAINKKRIV